MAERDVWLLGDEQQMEFTWKLFFSIWLDWVTNMSSYVCVWVSGQGGVFDLDSNRHIYHVRAEYVNMK